MGATRPLREVFAEVSTGGGGTDPQGVLAAAGHPDLPPDLLGEAVVNYADTASPEVAEHLAPLVTAHTGVLPGAGHGSGDQDPDWLDALAGAPQGVTDQASVDSGGGDPAVDLDGGWQMAPVPGAAEPAAPAHELTDLHFGQGDQAVVGRPGEEAAAPAADADSGMVDAVDDLDGLTAWSAADEPAERVDPFLEDVRGGAGDPGTEDRGGDVGPDAGAAD